MDESQDLAIANTLLNDPVYWRSVDPGSHGPLTELPLVLGKLAGFALDYSLAKTINMVLVILSTCFLYLAFSGLFSEKTARLACIPLVTLHSLTHFWDFLSFNAEGPLIFMISLALLQLSRLYAAEGNARSSPRWYLLGLTLGSVPYSKLQGVPIALVISVWGVVFLWSQHFEWKKRLRLSGWYILGGFSCSLFVGIYLFAFKIWDDFIFRYILQNLLYTQRSNQSFTNKIATFIYDLSTNSPSNTFLHQQFLLLILLTLICTGIIVWNFFSKSEIKSSSTKNHGNIALLFSFLVMFVCTYCTFIPGRLFYHYLLLLIPGIGLLLCALLYFLDVKGYKYILRLFIAAILFSSLSFALDINHFKKKIAIFQPHKSFAAFKLPASDIISQMAVHGDTMVVWGWFYRLHVETGLPMATRTTPMHIFGMPQLKEAYLKSFLKEFQEAEPAFFIEAVGEGIKIFKDKKKYGVDAFPRLRRILDKEYAQVGWIGPLRIFHRRR